MDTWHIVSTHSEITCTQCARAVQGAKYRVLAWGVKQASYTAFGPVFAKQHKATATYIEEE